MLNWHEIIATFGRHLRIYRAGRTACPRWQTDFLARYELPFPLRLAWDRSRTITQMTCHRRMTCIYASVLRRHTEQQA